MEGLGLILLGPPGSGKGTQAELFENRLGLKKISTGDILRDAIRKGTELGKLAKEHINRGELVPDDIVVALVEEALKKTSDGYILDGFPRTIEQAKRLDRILEKLGKKLDAAVLFAVPDEEIIKRLSARRVCPKCHAVYNMVTKPPKRDEICDICGTLLIMRDDDKPETVRRRIEVYRRDTEPLVDFYRDRGLLVEVKAVGDPEEVFNFIIGALKR
ncbi:MAG: adenylate kinase [Candidatus Hydrothermae bacterium]|nr:adenylate kinase [Candidatus Hydrothermae bacterium]